MNEAGREALSSPPSRIARQELIFAVLRQRSVDNRPEAKSGAESQAHSVGLICFSHASCKRVRTKSSRVPQNPNHRLARTSFRRMAFAMSNRVSTATPRAWPCRAPSHSSTLRNLPVLSRGSAMRVHSTRHVSQCRKSDETRETWDGPPVPAACRESLTLIVRMLARQAARETFLAGGGEHEGTLDEKP